MCFVESSLSEGEDGGRKTSEEAHAIVWVEILQLGPGEMGVVEVDSHLADIEPSLNEACE